MLGNACGRRTGRGALLAPPVRPVRCTGTQERGPGKHAGLRLNLVPTTIRNLPGVLHTMVVSDQLPVAIVLSQVLPEYV